MKVLANNGSARKDGNTALLIHTVFEELNKEGPPYVRLAGPAGERGTVSINKICFRRFLKR